MPLLWLDMDRERGLHPNGRVLIVAPGFLHEHWQAEARQHFGIPRLIPLDSQEKYLSARKAAGGQLPSGYYLTSFTELGQNGVKRMLDPDNPKYDTDELRRFYGVTDREVAEGMMAAGIGADPDYIARILCHRRHHEYSKSVGKSVNGIRSTYSPSLAELCRNEFECVVVDEGTRLRGFYETYIASGVLTMAPKYRLILTGTPVKNRLPDLFALLYWVSGGNDRATPRFPYDANGRGRFSEDFLVCERNLSRERAANYGRTLTPFMRDGRYRKGRPTAEVCNIHKLWRVIAPNILRRRKQDAGEEIVPKIRYPVIVPMGRFQREVYRYHLEARYTDPDGRLTIGAQLQALRMAAVAPHAENLREIGGRPGSHRSPTDYTPKLATILTLIEQKIRQGEQVVVFSSFIEPLETISRRLAEAGVWHFQLDGRKSPMKRGELSEIFKRGRPHAPPVMLACRPATSEGNNWYLARNVIHADLDYALDQNEQSDDRVHRINSPLPVNSYRVLTSGSIDRRIEALYEEKSQSAGLVLDGALYETATEELNPFDLLEIAREEFRACEVLDEGELESGWPKLRDQLAEAWQATEGARIASVAA